MDTGESGESVEVTSTELYASTVDKSTATNCDVSQEVGCEKDYIILS